MAKTKLVFPLFNTLIGAVVGALIGYYISEIAITTLLGGLGGLTSGLLFELLFSRLGIAWLYQRRVLFSVLFEIPLAIFVFGPYAYVLAETRPNQHSICCETPLDYGATRYENVRIQTTDGVVLAGWYVPPRKTPGAVIVLLHGARGDRRGTAWFARQLIQAGYGVLLYDQRALGESTGTTLSFGWLDSADLLAVIEYVRNRAEVDPQRIGAVGLSLGGYIALNAAYRAPDRMAALWLDGIGAQRIEDFPTARNVNEQFDTFINACIIKMMEFHFNRPVPPAFGQILAALDRPKIMLVAGELDDFEARAHRQFASVIRSNTRIWFIENADHVAGPSVSPAEYARRMLEFFQTALEN